MIFKQKNLFVVFLFCFSTINASHYRGGSSYWFTIEEDSNSTTVAVRIYNRQSWRNSALLSPCTNDASNTSELIGDGAYECKTNSCSELSNRQKLVTTAVSCTDCNDQFDYATGEKYTTLYLPPNRRFNYTFQSCCWISLLSNSGEPDWSLNMMINTYRRLDGKFNSAPSTAMLPVVRCEVDTICTFTIPMRDSDNDPIQCRWGQSSNECGDICSPKGDLQPYPCVLTYNATEVGDEGVAVVIEDFDTNGQVLSSVPLQFLIHIHEKPPPPPCPWPPVYIGNITNGQCIGVSSGSTIREEIRVKIPCNNTATNVSNILTISPSGMTKSAITRDPVDSDIYIMIVEWTPRADQYGVHQFCWIPVSSEGQTGLQTCVTYQVDVHQPKFITQSMTPTGIVSVNQSEWSILLDRDIVPPTRSDIYIRFYKRNSNGNDQEILRINALNDVRYQPRNISFSTYGTTWEQGAEYYILFDAGVAAINASCGVESGAITNTTFWAFFVPFPSCDQAPIYIDNIDNCTMISSNSTFSRTVLFRVPCVNTSTTITNFTTNLPTGMNISSITRHPNDSNVYILHLVWHPRSNQQGIYIYCITPIDSEGHEGAQICFVVEVDAQLPEFVLDSMIPTGRVPYDQSVWSIGVNQPALSPAPLNAYFRFFKKQLNGTDQEVLAVDASTFYYDYWRISFTTNNATWEYGQQYYILMDPGVAIASNICKRQTAAINDTNFWTFWIEIPTTTTTTTSITTATETTADVEGSGETTDITSTEQSSEHTTSTTTTTETTVDVEGSGETTDITSTEQSSETTSVTTTTTAVTSTEESSETTSVTTAAATTTAHETTTPITETATEVASTEESSETTSVTTAAAAATTTTTTTAATTDVTSIEQSSETTSVTTTTTVGETTTDVTSTEQSSETSPITTTTTTMTTTTTTTSTTSPITTTTTTTALRNTTSLCPHWLPWGTIMNVTTNETHPNYTFCFTVNTTKADITILANTWTSCSAWKSSGAADPFMELFTPADNKTCAAQNDDGASIVELNCYAAVLSYRLVKGDHRVVIRHQRCNFGRFELRLKGEVNNGCK